MSPLVLFLVLIASPTLYAEVTCRRHFRNVQLCTEGSKLISVTPLGKLHDLTLSLAGYSSIAPNAFANLKVKSLNLFFGTPGSCAQKSFSFDPESFNGLDSSLVKLEISCWTGEDTQSLRSLKNLKYLNLIDSGFTAVPKALFAGLDNLKTLEIRNHNIKTLTEDSFSGISKEIKVIFIVNGVLESIQGKPFNNLKNLDSLWLNDNQISELQPGVFDGLVKLRKVILTGNQIQKLSNGVFTSEHRALRILIAKDNQISVIDGGVFGKLNFTWIDLSKNQLEALPVAGFDGLQKLETLELSNNKFSVIPSNYFSKVKNLLQLTIENGELSSIQAKAFAGLKLGSLKIRYNKNLNQLESGAFSGLSINGFLELGYNHLEVIKENAFLDLETYEIQLYGNQLESKDVQKWGVAEGIRVRF